MTGIRVDANSIIATGHMMRCITIARAIVRRGGSVTFFIADRESGKLLERELGKINDTDVNTTNAHTDPDGSVRVVVLDSRWDDMESELPVLIEQLQLRNIDMLLVDSYKVTYDYFKAINRICRTAYIDDLHESIYPVDILINYSGYYDIFDYEKDYAGVHGYGSDATKLLLGLKYAPLREQFMAPYKEYHEGSYEDGAYIGGLNILLASGGADRLGMILSTLETASERGLIGSESSVMWQVVAGDYVDNIEEIEAFVSMHEGVRLHRSVEDMAALMRECDLAIVAAGTMLTECAAVKLPAVFYQIADNQRYGVDYWSAPDKMIYAGNAEADKEAVIASIMKNLRNIINDPVVLASVRSRISDITDGAGAERIAKELG